MELYYTEIIAYIVGSLVGFFLNKSLVRSHYNDVIEMLIENGFLNYKTDENGNIIILKINKKQ